MIAYITKIKSDLTLKIPRVEKCCCFPLKFAVILVNVLLLVSLSKTMYGKCIASSILLLLNY